MVIDCSQCEFHPVACGDCLVTVLLENDPQQNSRKGREMGNQDISPDRQAIGVQELRALNVLATAGLVPPLRYRPTPVGKLTSAIVAL